MPTSQKSSLNSHMNSTSREKAGVSPLMGLTQHHQSNTIHEPSGSGVRLKTKMFTMLNFCTNSCVCVILFCLTTISLILHQFLFFLTSLSDFIALISDQAQCQSIYQIHFTEINYLPKTVTATKDKSSDILHCADLFLGNSQTSGI